MSHAGFGHVHAYSTQIFLAHLLLCHTFHDIRAGNKHIAGIFYHENKVSQCRWINSSPGTRSHNRTYLRNHSRRHRVAQEYFGISCQRTDTFLNTRTSRIIQSDDRCPHLHRHIHHLADFLGMCFWKSSSEHGKILCKDINQALADHAITGDNSVSCKLLLLHTEIGTTVSNQLVQFDKRTFFQK